MHLIYDTFKQELIIDFQYVATAMRCKIDLRLNTTFWLVYLDNISKDVNDEDTESDR